MLKKYKILLESIKDKSLHIFQTSRLTENVKKGRAKKSLYNHKFDIDLIEVYDKIRHILDMNCCHLLTWNRDNCVSRVGIETASKWAIVMNYNAVKLNKKYLINSKEMKNNSCNICHVYQIGNKKIYWTGFETIGRE